MCRIVVIGFAAMATIVCHITQRNRLTTETQRSQRVLCQLCVLGVSVVHFCAPSATLRKCAYSPSPLASSLL